MRSTSLWKRLVAMPAVLALSATGVMVGASAAQADPADLSVTSPTAGQTTDSRTVTFTGTGTNGSVVNVLDADDDRIPGTTAAVVSNGTWSTTGTYADDADIDQTVFVNQSTGFSGDGEVTRSFSLPEAELPFTIDSPAEGETVDSRTVTFTGTGTDGSIVNVLDANDDRIPGTTAAVVSNGTWSTTGTYDDDADVDQTVFVNQSTGFSGDGVIERSFSLPAAAELPFTIDSPAEGETVDSRTVTFSGTGTDGSIINVLDANGDRVPENNTVVINGTWSLTATYAADADVNQTVFVNQSTGFSGDGVIERSFLLPAAAIVDPPVDPADPEEPTDDAGSDDSDSDASDVTPVAQASNNGVLPDAGGAPVGLLAAGALLLTAGSAFVVAGKKRRQQV